jgi:16S rRNA G1207 methylase RsmC
MCAEIGHSQRCCAAAAEQHFERVSIVPKNRQQLEHVLVQCNKILQADKRSTIIGAARHG